MTDPRKEQSALEPWKGMTWDEMVDEIEEARRETSYERLEAEDGE